MGSVFLLLQGIEAGWFGRTVLGSVDMRLGADNSPEPTTVKAALYTGQSPLALTGRHRRGRPDEALAAFIRAESLFRRYPVFYANAHRPDAFRQPPTPVMLAAEGAALPIRTLGDLRRGDALAGDLTGQALIARGHRDVPLLTPADVARRLEGWCRAGHLVVLEVERTTPRPVVDAVVEELTRQGVPWMALLLPDEGPAPWPDQAPVVSNHRFPLPPDVPGLLPRWWSA